MKYDEFFYVRKTKTIPMQANCPYGMQLWTEIHLYRSRNDEKKNYAKIITEETVRNEENKTKKEKH